LFFNGKPAVITAATATQLNTTVPLAAGTGKVSVSVNNGAVISGPVFTYQLTGLVSTFAGSGGKIGSIDGTGAAAEFGQLWGIVFDKAGNLYVCDSFESTIRKITPTAQVTTFAGKANVFGDADGKGAAASFKAPKGLGIDAAGNLYVGDGPLIRKITADGTVSTIYHGDANSRILAMVFDSQGNMFIADQGDNVIRKISTAGVSTVFAGSGKDGFSIDGKGTAASFNNPGGIAVDPSGNLYVTDQLSNVVRKITPDATVTTFAGSSGQGFFNSKALSSTFNYPLGITIDATGNFYIGDSENSMVRRIGTDGMVTTIAGNANFATVDGVGFKAELAGSTYIAIDTTGNLYVATLGSTIRKIVIQ
jgi:serine/threonine-protein kinase